MREMRIFVSDHQRSKLRQREPKRHLPLEHAALVRLIGFARAFAGDDERDAHAVGLRAPQEGQQCHMRLRLGKTVQINPRIDRLAAARDTPGCTTKILSLTGNVRLISLMALPMCGSFCELS